MTIFLLITAVVLVLCFFSDRLSGKIGVPALLIFIGVGMLFGCDGLLKIPFENYNFAESVCEAALVVIMFTGGFSVNAKQAKPAAVKACLMSTLGVAITAGVTGLFCYFVLHFSAAESFLVGSVISSTDAASVFSVLRSKKLNLKNGLAPLLEVESGSNDPFSYMLTILALSVYEGLKPGRIFLMTAAQLGFGILFGVGVGIAVVYIARHFASSSDGFGCILFLAAALLAYGLPVLFGGNGYLSVYIAGIIIGNSKVPKKSEAVVFFNGITGLCQIAAFFLLGLLASPSRFADSLLPALLIYLCLTLLSRPAAVLALCGKMSLKERAFVSLAGLRGASSIVFAITAVTHGGSTKADIFNIVFIVCLMSMLFQGWLLPSAAKKLDLIDDSSDVLKTFNDYCAESPVSAVRIYISQGHPWANLPLSQVRLPDGSRAMMIKRGKKTIVPRGNTVILEDDNLILSVPAWDESGDLPLREIHIGTRHSWKGSRISELNLPENLLIVLIKREDESLIPDGNTEILEGDTVVVTDS